MAEGKGKEGRKDVGERKKQRTDKMGKEKEGILKEEERKIRKRE